MIKSIAERRTIRRYKANDVDTTLIKELLAEASRASTTGNMQLYSVVITKDEGKKQEMASAHFSQPTFVNAPVVLTFCADYNRFNKWCEQRNATPGYDNFQSFMTGAIDTLLLAQNFATLAEEAGLGICYLGTTTYNAPQIAKALNLPHFVVPITTLTLGYPDEQPQQQDRIPVDGFVHEEEYKDYTDTDIDRIFAPKEALPVNLAFVKENGKESLAQIFTDIRYTKKDGDFFSKVYWEFIKEQFQF